MEDDVGEIKGVACEIRGVVKPCWCASNGSSYAILSLALTRGRRFTEEPNAIPPVGLIFVTTSSYCTQLGFFRIEGLINEEALVNTS